MAALFGGSIDSRSPGSRIAITSSTIASIAARVSTA
jgi:hypothetical protein